MTDIRITWIDIAKAISLVLVIFIHSIPRDYVTAILTGFVMPAFFILYGVAHNNEKHRSNLREYFWGRFKSLMIPYILLSVVMILMYYSFYPQIDLGLTPLDTVFWFIYGNGPIGRVTHLWFLRTMFFAIVLFSILDRYLFDKSGLTRLSVILGVPILGVLLKYVSGVELVPWGADAVLISLSFIMIGNEIRRVNQLLPWSIDRSFDGIAVFASLIVYILLASFNGFVNIGESLYGQSIIIYMITGVLGTYVLCAFSYYMSKENRVFSILATRFNKYAQEIYELHPLMIELNVQVLGGLAIWNLISIYPGLLLFLVNFVSALFVPYIIASQIISRSRPLQFMFLGKGAPRVAIPLSQPLSQPLYSEIEIEESYV
jgi:fucose 4-O-acetylase-like acetyltransferase